MMLLTPRSTGAYLVACTLLNTGSFASAEATSSEASGARFGRATSGDEELREDRLNAGRDGLNPWEQWKKSLKDETGFEFTLEYNSLGQLYSDGTDAAGGLLRLSGRWTVLNRGSNNYGALVYKVDHRHAYTELSPQIGGIASGSALPTGTLFSDREWGLVNLHWTQSILNGQAGYAVGWFPADDYFHSYALANPLTGFSNLAFSVGSDFGLPDSGLGVAAAGMLGDHWYFKGGIHDANGNAGDPNFDVFGDWELYKNLEIGWTTDKERVFFDNFHLGIWHVDERSAAGVPEGWGIVGNASWYFEDSGLLPFLRGGWSTGDAALLESSVTAGVGKKFRERDLAGIGVSWGNPSSPDTGDQWTSELFYRIQLGNLALTPSIQLVSNPANDPDEDLLLLGSLRARITF